MNTRPNSSGTVQTQLKKADIKRLLQSLKITTSAGSCINIVKETNRYTQQNLEVNQQ